MSAPTGNWRTRRPPTTSGRPPMCPSPSVCDFRGFTNGRVVPQHGAAFSVVGCLSSSWPVDRHG
jgi:hypothetical protein